jgi:hypothetical protein
MRIGSKLQNPKNRCCDCCGDHADKLPPCLEPKRELGYEISFHLHMCYVVSRRECCWKTVDFCGRFEFETQLLRNRSSRSHRPGPLQYSRWCELKVPPTSQFSGRIYIDSTTDGEKSGAHNALNDNTVSPRITPLDHPAGWKWVATNINRCRICNGLIYLCRQSYRVIHLALYKVSRLLTIPHEFLHLRKPPWRLARRRDGKER